MEEAVTKKKRGTYQNHD